MSEIPLPRGWNGRAKPSSRVNRDSETRKRKRAINELSRLAQSRAASTTMLWPSGAGWRRDPGRLAVTGAMGSGESTWSVTGLPGASYGGRPAHMPR